MLCFYDKILHLTNRSRWIAFLSLLNIILFPEVWILYFFTSRSERITYIGIKTWKLFHDSSYFMTGLIVAMTYALHSASSWALGKVMEEGTLSYFLHFVYVYLYFFILDTWILFYFYRCVSIQVDMAIFSSLVLFHSYLINWIYRQ